MAYKGKKENQKLTGPPPQKNTARWQLQTPKCLNEGLSKSSPHKSKIKLEKWSQRIISGLQELTKGRQQIEKLFNKAAEP